MSNNPFIKAGKFVPKQKRSSRAKLLEALGNDEVLTNFLITLARALRRCPEVRRLRLIRESSATAVQHYQKSGRRMYSSCPYGWMRDPNDSAMMIQNEYEQQVIRRILELRADGMTLRKIAKRLAFDGLENRLRNAWHPDQINAILKRSK